MAATDDLRMQLREVELEEVEGIGRELGRGAYGVVMEHKVRGLRCAVKKLHELFFTESSDEERQSATARFAQECLRHSKIHHPNIVQLIGVHFSPKSRIPSLVMELMPLSLTQALQQYPSMPSHVKNQILLDISTGLHFLHTRTPPIIHRDLTANNVLLSENMRAKIADLGQAKIVSIHPMTKTPGNVIYMPPESFVAKPVYNAKLDIFSLGALIIHMFIHDWPTPTELLHPDPAHPGQLIPLTEIERRAHFLEGMGEGHPLTDLTTRCLQNDPALRPTTAEVIQQLEGIIQNDPPPFVNTLDMIQEINNKTESVQALYTENQTLTSFYTAEVETLNEHITTFEAQIQSLETDKQTLEVTQSSSVTQIKALNEQMETIQAQMKLLLTEKHALEAKGATNTALSQEKIETLQKQVQNLGLEKENLETAQTQTLLRVEELVTLIRGLRCEQSNLRSQLQVQQQQVELLRKELAIQQQVIENQKQKITLKQQQIDAKKQETVTLREAKEGEHSLRMSEVHKLREHIRTMEEVKDTEIAALQQEITLLREGLQMKDAEIAIQREQIHMGEEEVAIKAAEVYTLLNKGRVVHPLGKEAEGVPTKAILAANSNTETDISLSLENILVEVENVLDWYSLGLYLGVDSEILDQLSGGETWGEECMSNLVRHWLSTGHASWKSLASALNAVGETEASQVIIRSYCKLVETTGPVYPVITKK